MIIDILQTILNYGIEVDQINCMSINTFVYSNLYIYKLDCRCNDSRDCKYKFVNQKILEQKKFSRLKILYCGKTIINDVNHLKDSLEKLDCSYGYVDQNGISELKKLKALNCGGNDLIVDVNFLSETLEYLNCCMGSGISEKGIEKLKKINYLYCCGNDKIKNVSHMYPVLRRLDNGKCSVEYEDLFDVKKNRMKKFLITRKMKWKRMEKMENTQ